MPIYHKTPPTVSGSHATSEIDNHTSEAAKVKRTREQAYFNSYDFDAIEVLPYDDEDEEDGEGRHKGNRDGRGHNKSAITTTNSQQHLKSKQKQQPQQQLHSSQTRQHLPPSSTAQASFGYSSSKQPHPQHQPPAAVRGKISSTSDNFIVDKHPPHLSSHGQAKMPGNKHTSSYLQRFGVALFGGINVNPTTNNNNASGHKGGSNHNSASSSLSTTSTSSSFADDDEDDIKHLKVSSSGISSSTSSASSKSRTKASCCSSSSSSTSSSAAAAAETSMAVDSLDQNIANETAATAVDINAKEAAAAATPTAASSADGNFLLPRVMLKYQSTLNAGGGSSNNNSKSMSTPATTTTNSPASVMSSNSGSVTNNLAMAQTLATGSGGGGGNAGRMKKHSTTSSSLSSLGSEEIVEIHREDEDDSSKVAKEFKVMPKLARTPGRAASHQSHYSTDKSASSGYYSSNVCSTYSLEEHIYSEPTIELKEIAIGHKANLIAGHPSESGKGKMVNEKPLAGNGETFCGQDDDDEASVMRTLDYNRRFRYSDHQKPGNEANAAQQQTLCRFNGAQTSSNPSSSKEFKENLRILESSIENLDRHLKSFPRGMIMGSSAAAAAAGGVGGGVTDAITHHRGEEKIRASYSHLPTIREGYDATAIGTLKRGWSEDPVTDDSLIDIDLDSFLLDEAGKKDKKQNPKHQQLPPAKTKALGIDNPTFLSEEQEENHYKCAKYINSCPEDAYRVESDIIAPARSSISEQSVAVSVSDLYPKRYEDQLHFQNTRELLEDVRDKIRLLNLTQEPPSGAQSRRQIQAPTGNNLTLDEYIPKELHTMIGTLKRELELYLQRMNQHSELEIRQLCTGLVKNQNIVKMKNAFERRRSLSDMSDHLSTYETSGLPPISIRQEVTTIKCASDPNFKMKRKSLTEVFPISECYVETLRTFGNGMERQSDPLPPLPGGGSQLQRNLNFHQASIQQFETDTNSNFEKLNNPRTTGSVRKHDNSASGSCCASASASSSNSPNDSSDPQDKDSILEWHRKKPSIWEMYYGTNRIQQSLLGGNGKKNGLMVTGNTSSSTPSPMCYPSSRPESDFTLDLPRAEQLRIKMEKEKKFRQRCRVITTFLSLVFFLLTVMVVSLVLTRGKRMFGSMI